MHMPSKRTLGLILGAIYLAFGSVEVVTHLDDSALALLFWGGSLLGGGSLVIAGTLLLARRRTLGLTLLTVGALVATNATIWTLLLPLFAVFVVVRAYLDEDPGPTVMASPTETQKPA
jgi:hypothetical protein